MFANAIYGGIIGDMVGSIYEWKPCLKDKVYTFPLWQGSPIQFLRHESQRTGSRYTDDTVTGLAVADALLHIKDFSDDEAVKQAFIRGLSRIPTPLLPDGRQDKWWVVHQFYERDMSSLRMDRVRQSFLDMATFSQK